MIGTLKIENVSGFLWLLVTIWGGYAAAYHESYNFVLGFVMFSICCTIMLGAKITVLENKLKEQSLSHPSAGAKKPGAN